MDHPLQINPWRQKQCNSSKILSSDINGAMSHVVLRRTARTILQNCVQFIGSASNVAQFEFADRFVLTIGDGIRKQGGSFEDAARLQGQEIELHCSAGLDGS